MPQFAYKAMQLDGVLVEGSLDASSRQEAMRQVEVRGLKPIRLAEAPNGTKSSAAGKSGTARHPNASASEVTTAPSGGIRFGQSTKITPRILENFTRLLSSLLAAGVPFS